MTIMIVLLAISVLLLIFAVYIAGLVSSKLDLIVYYMKLLQQSSPDEEKDNLQKQFMGMMNYTANERRDADE